MAVIVFQVLFSRQTYQRCAQAALSSTVKHWELFASSLMSSQSVWICLPLLHGTPVHTRHSSITLRPSEDDVITSSGLSTGRWCSTSSLMRSSLHQFVPASSPSPDDSPLPFPAQSAALVPWSQGFLEPCSGRDAACRWTETKGSATVCGVG